MSNPSPRRFLRRALQLDAIASGLSVVLAIAGAEVLAPVLGLPAPLLFWTGIGLIPFLVLVTWTATRPAIPAGPVRLIVGANLAWVVASVGLLLTGWVVPTTLGVVVVVAQAVAVAVFAELQVIGLRRPAVAAA